MAHGHSNLQPFDSNLLLEPSAGGEAAGGGFTTSQAIDTGSALLTALAQIRQAQQQEAAFKVKAAFERFNAEQEFVSARSSANAIARQREDVVGSINASYAANGVDLSSDTAIFAGERARQAAARARAQFLTAGEIRRETRKINAANLLIQAENARNAGILNALGGLAKAAFSIANPAAAGGFG